MVKDSRLTLEVCSGKGGVASAWRYYLPADSQAIRCFMEPVSISIKGPMQSGPPPKDSGRAMKVFVDNTQRWQDSQAVIDAFRQLWPEILRFVARLSNETVELVHFSGQATTNELLSLLPYLPFEFGNDTRFFVSEVSKLTRTRNSASMWLCVEYSYDDFKQLASPNGFQYSYGTTIMGISVVEAKVDTYLQKDLLNQIVLEEALKDKDLRCWWFCDADFEGMTVWHKDYSGNDLLVSLQDVIKGQAKKLGLTVE